MAPQSEPLASILQPHGNAIGRGKEDPSIRVLSGGAAEAIAMFAHLAAGGTVVDDARLACLREDGATVTLSAVGNMVAIDIDGGDTWVRRLEFVVPGSQRDGGMDG